MASEKAIPFLEDQSWNECLVEGPFENITDIISLTEGDSVDLGGITLKIFDVPGHMKDHISILDEKNKNIFVGDSIGCKTEDQFFFSPFMPPHWEKDGFYNSVNKIREIDHDSLCLAHFGYIYGKEARSILDEAEKVYELWWELFERNVDKLDDTSFMLEVISREANLVFPDIEILGLKPKILSGLMTGWNKLARKKPLSLSKIITSQIITQLVRGFRTSKNL